MHVWQYAYEQYQTEGKEGAFHGSIQKTANFLRTGTRTVREVVRELDPKREGLRAPVVLPVGVARRVSAHRTRAELTPEQITAARAFVADRIGRGACVTYRDITVRLGTDLLVHTVRRRLIELGFKVLPVRPRPAIDFAAPYWSSQFERFAVQMAEAWEAERDGSGAVIFMDESFCHLRHSRWQSVVDTTAADQVVKPRKSGERASIPSGGSKGQLVIVVHAISSKGLLADSNEDGSLHKPPIDCKKHVTFTPSAELVYPVGAPPTSDYHNSLNGASFSNWVQLRLLPAFWRAYGKKRMYLVLDNCKVHCTRPKGFVPATAAQKKGALAKVLNDNGVKSIRAENGSYDAICHARNFMASKKDGGCTKPELLAAVKQLYANKPELCFTELQTILRRGAPDRPAHEWRQYEEFAQPNFHKIVHTVQYNSAHNPIEIIWAAVKGHVAALHTADRTTAELLLHLREGFYGSADGEWKGVTPERCQKAIAHCKSVVTGIIRGSAKLRACYPDGTVEADMHADSFGEECRAKYGKIALSREAAAFADGQSTEYGGEGDDPDAIADWEADGGDDAAGLAD